MNQNNFHGLKDFVWWVGVVEDRVDPLGIGRCKIRVFGYHTPDAKILPTADLPWAHPLYPLNNSKNFSSPMIGDWIQGYFMDGESGQFPIMVGVLPAVEPNQANTKPSSANTVVQPVLAPTQVKNGKPVETKAPSVTAPATSDKPKVSGRPTTPARAIGNIANTAVSKENSELDFVKDISGDIKYAIAAVTKQVNSILESARGLVEQAFQMILSFFDGSPFSDESRNLSKTVQAKAKLAQEYAKETKQQVSAMQQYVKEMQDFVKTIQELPARIASAVGDLLSQAQDELKQAMSQSVKLPT